MKEYTTTLISLARDDLSLAQSAIVGQPHLAAFHAQQCAEKAIKAVAYELGPFESEAQFRPMAKQVGHNSMIACLQVVGTAIITAMKMAHEEQVRVKIEAGAKLGRSQRTLSSTVGWASRRALKRFFDSEFKKLNVEVKQKHRRKGAWAKSLDPSYDPSKGPRQDRDVKIPLSLRPFIWIYRWTMRKMGIKSEAAYKIDASSNPPEERFRFMDELLTEFKAKGNKDIQLV